MALPPAIPPPSLRPLIPSAEATAELASLVESVRKRVDTRLAEILAERRAEAASRGADTDALAGAVSELTMRGGKRLRPSMALSAFVASGGSGDDGAVIEAGAGLELLQTYLLIHDDWMDGDETRRGGPSVHALLRAHFGDRHKGDASAILAGDLASALSQECLARAVDGRPDASRIMIFFARMQQDVIHGQQLDLSGRAEDVEAMHALKTGAYTVKGPLVLGALFAGARPEVIASLERFAEPLGVAFQLRDDLLGAFGEERVTGKPFGSDLRAGKRTAVVGEAWARLSTEAQRRVRAVFGDASAPEPAVREAARALDECGARAAVEDRLDRLVGEALSRLRGAPFTPRGARLLEGATGALTARKS